VLQPFRNVLFLKCLKFYYNINMNPKISIIKNLLVSFRINNWIKNLLVFSALLFSKNLLHPFLFLNTLYVFIIFCFLSSSIYLLNDIIDIKNDRRHPFKKERPIASGLISIKLALITAICLLAVILPASFLLNKNLGLLVAAYIVINILYSFFVKKIVILDVFFLSTGFIIRVFAGGAVIGIFPSYWLMLCIFFLSLFLGFAKRNYELKKIQGYKTIYKDRKFLNIALYLFSAISIIIYVLYTISTRTIEVYGDFRLAFTIPFVVFGIIRYLYLNLNEERAIDPISILLKDKTSGINLLLWFALVIYLVYFLPA
jgi:decaprenyl-phosphate phosphoribosyltransferase